ncbi:MAG: sulfatase [Planctomycetota bacterium]
MVVMVDDLGWQDSSLRLTPEATAFNRRYRTPNLEALAARGVRFTDAYAAAPVCTPTRTSLMTGRSPARNHITYWTLHADRDTSAAHPTLRPPAWRKEGLDAKAATLPRALGAAGYRCIHVGKAHFGAIGTAAADPLALGFHRNVAGHAAGGPGSFLGTHHFRVAGRQGRDLESTPPAVWDVPGLEAWHGRDVYLTEALEAEARRELRDAVAAGRPFFLHFAPYCVHAPIMANPRHLADYEGLDPREAAYATMIATVDAALGGLLAEIEALGQTERTLVVFASDNGGLSAHARGGPPHTHNAPLRSGKGSAYEGGIRTPLVIAGPGVRRDGWCGAPVVTMDLLPTLLGRAGVAVPAEAVDGIDLRALIDEGIAPAERARREEALSRRVLLWHQPHQWGAKGPGIEPFSAVRRGPWKLIWFHADRRHELYRITDDPGETRDLAGREVEVMDSMKGALRDALRTAGAQLSIEREGGRAVTPEG